VSLIVFLTLSWPAEAQLAQSETDGVEIELYPVSQMLQRAEKNADSQEWHRVDTFLDAKGDIVLKTNVAYIELQTGMHYLEEGHWKESRELIEAFPGGAIARHGGHKVIFAENFYSEVVIDLEMPDGKGLQSRVLGLSYFDAASGKSILVAEATNSIGQILNTNQVLYPNAFSGLKADVRYTYRKAGLEQDVILLERPPAPEEFGLNSKTTRLQVLTEFLAPPTPEKRIERASDSEDQMLDFGSMRMIRGKAFSLGAENDAAKKVTVSKKWEVLDGRTVLIEEVLVGKISKQLELLPTKKRSAFFWNKKKPTRLAVGGLNLPARRSLNPSNRAMQLASNYAPAQGLVLDYVIVSTSITDYTFKGNVTYLISGDTSTFGTTTIEGGAVIKFGADETARININDPQVICATAAYRPAIFTAKDDDTVGELINGSTGTPGSSHYGGGIIFGGDYSSNPNFRNLRFRHLRTALTLGWDDSQVFTLEHSQIIHCQSAIFLTGAVNLRNCLFNQVPSVFTSIESETLWIGEHLTVSDCQYLANAHKPELHLTNSILAYIGNLEGPLVTSATWFTEYTPVLDTSGIFKSVGAGGHYLADNSQYRDQGTPDITPSLLEDLKQRTTYAPQVQSTPGTPISVPADTTWSIVAYRDTSAPDLGYHYDPLDHLVGNATLLGALTVSDGAAVGIFGPYGFRTGTLISKGTPLNRNKLVLYSAVQEHSTLWGANAASTYLLQNSASPVLHWRFTDVSLASGALFYGGWAKDMNIAHCSLFGIRMTCDTGSAVTLGFTNNILERCSLSFGQCAGSGYGIKFCNNLFLNSSLGVGHFCSATLVASLSAHNNLFITSIFSHGYASGFYPEISHNGYHNNTYVTSQGTSPVNITTLDFQAGPLGPYYYPASGGNLSLLIDAGSTTADTLSLCPFTTRNDQTRDVTSQADIGFHYVALDANNNPQDNNSNGLPDFDEMPVANPETVSPPLCRDTARTITLSGSGDSCTPLVFQIVSGPAHGSLDTTTPPNISDTTADVIYTPTALYCGPDSFTFKVRNNGRDSAPATVNITVGQQPSASPDTLQTCKTVPVNFTLNGSDPCDVTPTFQIVTAPSHGQLSGIMPNLTYTPNSSFCGEDSLQFKVVGECADSELATVTFTVGLKPTATSDSKQTCKDEPVNFTLSGSDPCAVTPTFQIVSGPSHGQLSGIIPDLTYTPNAGYCGPDSLEFKVVGACEDSDPVAVNFIVGDSSPEANCQDVMTGVNTPITFTLTGSDSCTDVLTFTKLTDPINGIITAFNPTTGSVTYQPNSGVEGTDTFTFKVSNCGFESGAQTVTIQVVSGPTLTTECRPDSIVLTWSLPPFLQELAASGYIQDFQIFRCTTTSGSCTPSATAFATISDPQVTTNPLRWRYVDTIVSSAQTYCYAITFRHKNDCDDTMVFESPRSSTSCNQICAVPPGGPTDIAFIIDNTGSMASGPLDQLKNNLTVVLNTIEASSGNDYRLALVTPDTETVNVRLNFSQNNRAAFASALSSVVASGGAGQAESTDECLNTIINTLSSSGRTDPRGCNPITPLQINDFSQSFRLTARKFVVLITDHEPGGYCDSGDGGVQAAIYAAQARASCIRINAVQVENNADATPIMLDYKVVTCGWHKQIPNDGTGIDDAVIRMLFIPGFPGSCDCP
jgi:hypothetical protein